MGATCTLFLFDPFAPRQMFPWPWFLRWLASRSSPSAAAPTSTSASPSRQLSLSVGLSLGLALIWLLVTHPGDLVVSTDSLVAGQGGLIPKFATTASPTVTIPISIPPLPLTQSYNTEYRDIRQASQPPLETLWISISCVLWFDIKIATTGEIYWYSLDVL